MQASEAKAESEGLAPAPKDVLPPPSEAELVAAVQGRGVHGRGVQKTAAMPCHVPMPTVPCPYGVLNITLRVPTLHDLH
ncbi:hypothetical protein OEZ86_008261 [Tetradesmus obliquus]|nr:hypothetical protein OEZ86_008261 [Tetradesmus obliquus]